MILILDNISSYCTYIHLSWPVLTLVIVKESILEVEVTEWTLLSIMMESMMIVMMMMMRRRRRRRTGDRGDLHPNVKSAL
jgi:hypothetical protein